MNKRIKELAAQCWDTRIDGRFHFDQEMFAQLIVLECLDVVDEEVSGMLGVHVMKKIAEHFGVK
jgi:hypothetical protein